MRMHRLRPPATTGARLHRDGVLIGGEAVIERALRDEINVPATRLAARFQWCRYDEIGAEVRKLFQVSLPSDFARLRTERVLDTLEWKVTATPGAFALLRRLSSPFCVVCNFPGKSVRAGLDSVGLGAFLAMLAFNNALHAKNRERSLRGRLLCRLKQTPCL